MAIKRIHTTHFYLCDMDFWPSCIYLLFFLFYSSRSLIWDFDLHAWRFVEWWMVRHDCSRFSIPKWHQILYSFQRLCWRVLSLYLSQIMVIRILPLLPSTKSELRQCMIKKNCTTFRPETRTHVSIHLFNCFYSYRLITMLSGLMNQRQRLFISSIIQIVCLWNRIPSYVSTIDLDILWYVSPITCRFLMKIFWTMDTTNNNGSRIFAILAISLV